MKRPCTKKDAPRENKGMIMAPAPTSKSPEELEFLGDPGASMHKMALRRSRNPSVVLAANGEVHTNEEAQVYVHDLDFFVRVQLLENTPVLSLGKLCEDHGYLMIGPAVRSRT